MTQNKWTLIFNSQHQSITTFWEQKDIDNKKFLSEKQFGVEHFKQNTKRALATENYIVRLAFNKKITKLSGRLKRQFYLLTAKLTKTVKSKRQYQKDMRLLWNIW